MKALVTGGGGFLGGAIVRQLRARGDEVVSLARGEYPELRALGVHAVQGDVAVLDDVLRAAEGCDVVFHVAAKAGIWGAYDDFHRVNVGGTQNAVDACRIFGIRKLVYTSSPSVVFDGRDMKGVTESVPYPPHYEAAYPATKAEAERLVLSASGLELATVALRPHLIWGPGDTQLVPRILARARAGILRRVGPGDNRVDHAYVDDAAAAHLLAADRLELESPISGRAYFITQGEPVNLWHFVNRILEAGGLPPVTKSIPTSLAYLAGWLLEGWHHLFRLESEPRMTRFLARELATSHWFSIQAARDDLGYEPKVSLDDGLARLADWLARKPVDR